LKAQDKQQQGKN